MSEQKIERQLADRKESYSHEEHGYCSCGEKIIKVHGSNVASQADGARYIYPGELTAWGIFRCKSCSSVIDDNWTSTPIEKEDEQDSTLKLLSDLLEFSKKVQDIAISPEAKRELNELETRYSNLIKHRKQ